MSIHLDVTSEDDWRSVVDLAGSKYGKLDILVNNAGMTIPKPLEETTADDWAGRRCGDGSTGCSPWGCGGGNAAAFLPYGSEHLEG